MQAAMFLQWWNEWRTDNERGCRSVDLFILGCTWVSMNFFQHFPIILKFINYPCSSYPTRASYSGQVDEFRNPMKNELKTGQCLKRFQTRMQILLICILIKQQKHMAIKTFI